MENRTYQVRGVVIRPLTINDKEFNIGDTFFNKVFESTFNAIQDCLDVVEKVEVTNEQLEQENQHKKDDWAEKEESKQEKVQLKTSENKKIKKQENV